MYMAGWLLYRLGVLRQGGVFTLNRPKDILNIHLVVILISSAIVYYTIGGSMQVDATIKRGLDKVTTTVTKPNHSRSYNFCVKADALRFAKMYKESVQTYLQAIIADRTELNAYYGLALSYKYLKNYKKAISTLERLIELDDSNDSYFMELGICSLSDGEPDKAIGFLVKAILINRENTEAQIQLAIAHELVGEPELSLMIYNKLIETNPEFLKAYYNKAAMLMGMEDFEEASKTFFQIIKKNPDYYKAYLGIAMSFDKMGKYTDAIRYYKKFLELKRFSEDSIFARNRINELRPIHFSRENNLRLV